MADDMTAQEMAERSKRAASYGSSSSDSLADCLESDFQKIERLGDVRRDWEAWVSPVSKDMTFDTIAVRHQEVTAAWKASAAYRAGYEVIKETVLRQERLNITSCMCLGLGTFTGVESSEAAGVYFRTTSLSQLVAFECWVDQLKTKFDIKHIYFQEPRFSVLDEEFLRLRGYEILHTPESDTYMSVTTFLFTPGAEQHVQVSSLASAFPALYISNDLSVGLVGWHYPPFGPKVDTLKRREEEKLPLREAKNDRIELMRKFVNQRATRNLPDSSEYWFRDLILYYKPDSEAEITPLVVARHEGITYRHHEAMQIWRDNGYLEHLEGPRRSQISSRPTFHEWLGEDEDDFELKFDKRLGLFTFGGGGAD